ncbi:DinB family protein [Marihabitans asiaticum]|uniref:Uncharacterized protein DUF664 n=1 Tax=Marihabitans asiaticum TaxID=415218 RepID=A0A560WEC6_9MICO|nr:DinB family protein [Marihabitans asiaticum]TWD15978.1 uncharacterized protein DUF664 [Marihabitans asiaticum]
MTPETEELLIPLRTSRAALLLKLEGLSERDQRRPLTRTGTNLLGLVKHCAFVELGYFGDCFDRPSPVPYPWAQDESDIDDNLDMYAGEGESAADIVALARTAWAQADETFASTDLDATATVPWWPEDRRHPTLRRLIAHVSADVARHAGHADILREQLDGDVGLRPGMSNVPEHDEQWWADYRERLQRIADGC